MPVPNPPYMTAIKSEFQGPDNFSAYPRNGAYVGTNATTGAISTTVAGLAMSQFANAQKNVASPPSISPSPNPREYYYSSTNGTQAMSASIALNPSGGNGAYTYGVNNFTGSGTFSSPHQSINGNNVVMGATVSGVAAGSIRAFTLGIDVTVYSNGVQGNTVRCTINFTYERQSSTCVVIDSMVVEDLGILTKAGDIQVGHSLLISDPYLQDINSVVGEVLQSSGHLASCVRIVTESGAFLECSTTAPIPTVNGYVLAPDLKGERVPVAAVDQINAAHTEFEWEEVMEVRDIGLHPVQMLFLGHRCFWASGDGERFILHHNGKMIL